MEGVRQGSFGIPPQVKKQIEEAQQRRDAVPAAVEPPEKSPEVAESATDVKDEKELAKKDKEQFLALKKRYEELLNVVITEDIVSDYLFRGRMTITGVVIVAGKMTGTFRTLLAEELTEIAEHMSKWRAKYKKDHDGESPDATQVANEHAAWTLAYVWLSAEDKTKKKGGAFPLKIEDRREALRKLNTHLMEKATEAWNMLEMLIRFCLDEERFLKKS